MVVFHSRKFTFVNWLSGATLAGFALVSSIPVAASQLPGTMARQNSPATPVQPDNRLAQGIDTTSLSIAGADRLVEEGRAAVNSQDYELAIDKFQAARTTYNDLSRYYQDLASLFLGIDSQVNESNRVQALDAAQRRDQTSYELAVLYRAQGQPDQAVPLLMEILNSQQPTRDLGQKAYQQLYEIGFVNQPFTYNNGGGGPSSGGPSDNGGSGDQPAPDDGSNGTDSGS